MLEGNGPRAYSEKNQYDHNDQFVENGYFVTIIHGSYFSSNSTSRSHDEKSPSEKSNQKGCLQSDGFRFVQPVALRSFCKFFFSHQGVPNCDNAASNFNYNLWYFQLNYALLLALVVLVAMQWIHCHQFTLEVCFTLVVLAVLYMLGNGGFQVNALGRKIRLSEQYAAVITFMVLYNGFLPEAFDFIYFFGGYIVFVVIHASINQVSTFYHAAYPVYHI